MFPFTHTCCRGPVLAAMMIAVLGSIPLENLFAQGPLRRLLRRRRCCCARHTTSPHKEQVAWRHLFDGQTLKGWKKTNFGGEGEVTVKNGILELEMGANLTGITWNGGEIPRMNYEISLEARRTLGGDFFCGLTFPVGKDPCSLIIGGWGGGVCGLSSLDKLDASENETTTYRTFKSNRWYRVRLRVLENRIQAWLDDEKIVDVDTSDKAISIRPEVELSQPLGLATWQTTAELRDIKVRKVGKE